MDGTRARALLGVSAHATPDELRQAFRRRALSTHPDRGGDAAGFDETVIAFRSLAQHLPRSPAARAPRGDAVDATEPHTPFDRYDSTTRAGSTRRHDTFAEVLQRVTANAVAA